MTDELERRLYDKFPKMFRGKDMSIKENLMPFGVECDDGWFRLIWKLCMDIQNLIDKEGSFDFIITQIKEKLGTLCFYYSGGPTGVDNLVDEAEDDSANICEVCGVGGAKIRKAFGWYKSECEDHFNDRKNNLKPKKASDYLKVILKSVEIASREKEIEGGKSNE